jgi:hypothetical protein
MSNSPSLAPINSQVCEQCNSVIKRVVVLVTFMAVFPKSGGVHSYIRGPSGKYITQRTRRAAKSPLGVPIQWDLHSLGRPEVLRKSPKLSGGRIYIKAASEGGRKM